MSSVALTKAERENIIIATGLLDPNIVSLAKDLVKYVKATHPKTPLSIEGAILALGEIGIFMSIHDNAILPSDNNVKKYEYDRHDRLVKKQYVGIDK